MNWLPEHAPTLSFAKMAQAQIVAINAVTQVAGRLADTGAHLGTKEYRG